MKRSLLLLVLVSFFALSACTDAVVAPQLEDTELETEYLTELAISGPDAIGPTILESFTAVADLEVVSPGPQIVRDGKMRIRQVSYGPVTITKASGEVIEGTMNTRNEGWVDLETGSGEGHGTFTITTSQGEWSGTTEGAFFQMGEVFTCEFEGDGNGGYANTEIRGGMGNGSDAQTEYTMLEGEIVTHTSPW